MKKNYLNEIDNKVDELLDEVSTNRIHEMFSDPEYQELIYCLADSFSENKDNKNIIYHFSSGCFYLDVYDREIKGHGYCWNIDDENEQDFSIHYLTKIEKIFAYDGNLHIDGEHYRYIIPNLEHVEMIDYLLCCFLAQYKQELVKKDET